MRRLAAALALALAAHAPAGALELLMLDAPACEWCARWDAEIAPAYPRTAEGACAPLRRQGIRDALPEGVSLAKPPRYTPTFVLLDGGREVGRIDGYPGADFFWPMLGELIARAGAPCPGAGG